MTPSDVFAVDVLLSTDCSLRAFTRRVRSARSRASIGGCQVRAVHTAQKMTNAATATRIEKFFSDAAKSIIASYLDGRDLVHDEDAENHAAGRAKCHHLTGGGREQWPDIARRDQE